jgi:hypothetical protein
MMMPTLKASHFTFCGAYILGFLLCLQVMRRPPPQPIEPPSPLPSVLDSSLKSYKGWLSSRGLWSNRLSADVASFGANVSTEADFLRRQIHVRCVVFGRKKRKVKAIEDTWGKHCNQLSVYAAVNSRCETTEVGERIIEKAKSSWHLLCTVIREV